MSTSELALKGALLSGEHANARVGQVNLGNRVISSTGRCRANVVTLQPVYKEPSPLNPSARCLMCSLSRWCVGAPDRVLHLSPIWPHRALLCFIVYEGPSISQLLANIWFESVSLANVPCFLSLELRQEMARQRTITWRLTSLLLNG